MILRDIYKIVQKESNLITKAGATVVVIRNKLKIKE